MMFSINESSVWLTPGLNERLRELHARDGSAALSMSMLAAKLNEEFGTHFTRNAIVGRCRRLSLPAREAPIKRSYPKPKPKPGPKPMRIFKVDAPILPDIAIELPPGNRLTIYQTRDCDCKWPLGGAYDSPPFMYCGDPVANGQVYCGAHCAVAYNKAQKEWA